MKKSIYLSIYLSLIFSGLSVKIYAQPVDCSDLFITEIYAEVDTVFGKEYKIKNYAAEVFNPTGGTLDLGEYALRLTSTIDTVTYYLRGYLAAKSSYVIASSDGDLSLQSIADTLLSGMDFVPYMSLELVKKDSTILDKVGYLNVDTVHYFEIAEYISDPNYYLAQFSLDLSDLQEIDIRRGTSVTSGDPTFSYGDSTLFGQWSFHFFGDRSDLGSYIGECNLPEGIATVGFKTGQGFIFSWFGMDCDIVQSAPIELTVVDPSSPPPPNNLSDVSVTIMPSPNYNNTLVMGLSGNIYWDNHPSNPTCTENYPRNAITAKDALITADNYFSGARQTLFILTSNDPDVYIDQAANYKYIAMDPCENLSSPVLEKEETSIIYSTASSILEIITNKEKGNLIIYNLSGCIVKRYWVNNSQQFDLRGLIPSFYIARYQNKNTVKTLKFIKQ